VNRDVAVENTLRRGKAQQSANLTATDEDRLVRPKSDALATYFALLT